MVCASCDWIAICAERPESPLIRIPLTRRLFSPLFDPMCRMSRCTLLVLCHLAHLAHVAAMRESYVVLDDTMVCECKEVKSVTDCPDYKIKKDGFPPGFPRYYHEKAGHLTSSDRLWQSTNLKFRRTSIFPWHWVPEKFWATRLPFMLTHRWHWGS